MKRYRDIVGDGGSDIVAQVEAQAQALRRRLGDVRAIVAVVSGKGGVGKSSVTAALAALFAASRWSVGVLDADLNGPSMAKMLGVRGRPLAVTPEGVEPAVSSLGVRTMSMDLLLPSDAAPLSWEAPTQAEAHTWRGTMEANALREFLADTAWGRLDLLLVDLPPGVERLATLAGLVTLTGAVVVTIPSEVSHLVVKRSVTAARAAGVPLLGLVENMAGYACPDCGAVNPLFSGLGGRSLAEELAIPFLGHVPFDPRLAAACDRGVGLVGDPGAAARALGDVATAIRERLSATAS